MHAPAGADASFALEKERALAASLAGCGAAMVAFSAGVDSTYLLDVAHEVLGARATAVTADSPSLARSSLGEAQAFCRARGIAHQVVATDEFESDAYRANTGQRCYACKSALMRAMDGLARATALGRAGTALLIGAIADDLGDHRPGMRAAAEGGARWPLAELGFTKQEVRARSRARALATWDRPAEPCLSSRMPYGEEVTREGVAMVEAAEACLRALGFRTCRARHHAVGRTGAGAPRGWLCRIEVPEAELAEVVARRGELVARIRAIGYQSVTLDLAGFASGGFNALLTPAERRPPA
jgi:uncharacterized protein